MGLVYDYILGDLRISDLTSDTTPIVITSTIFNPIAVSTSQSVSDYEGYNHYLFTTGTDDLEFQIYGSHPLYSSTLTNVRFRIQKVDDTSGTVAVTDYNGDTIATLRYQWEYVDVMYTGASDYVVMNDPIFNSFDTYWYGVEWTPGQTNSTVTAIGNPVLFAQNAVTGYDMIYPAVVEEDGTIAYKLDPTNLSLKEDGVTASVLTGADGDVMTVYERMYFKAYRDTLRNKQQIMFSKYALPGFIEVPKHAVGIYPAYADLAGDSKLRSISGVTPTTNKGRSEFRTYAQNKTAHSKWSQEPFWYYEMKYWLMLVEFLNMNSQTNLGDGASNASSDDWSSYNAYNPVWTTDGGSAAATGAGTVTATPADPNTANVRNGSIPLTVSDFVGGTGDLSTQMAIFHWQRDVFGHIWEWKDGINIYNSAENSETYICKNPANFADDTFTNYEFYKNIAEGNGYVNTFAEGSMLPLLTGGTGSGSNHCGDYFYTAYPTVGFRGLFAGGYLHLGAFDGLASLRVSYPASDRHASIGSRLFLEF